MIHLWTRSGRFFILNSEVDRLRLTKVPEIPIFNSV